ncbi:unnamed protein product [Adineta ricciae]|uniref:RNA-directed DNA polymerase n=1 Tax=Adineta ricciae TaxID=249248 RepID=A0A815QB64_ADIRI|nr:unnamed protein product [Adineta ricciae]
MNAETETDTGIQVQRRSGSRLREFDPSAYDWDEWEILLDTFFKVEGIRNEEKKRDLLITALGVKPFKTLIALCKPAKPADFTYETILTKLRTNYARVTFASTERIKFFSLKQSSTQSLTDFANDLRDKTTTCKFPMDFYEEALITAFVGGLLDAAVRKHLMQKQLDTFEETLNAANTISSVLTQGASVVRDGTEDLTINKIQKRHGFPNKPTSSGDCLSCGSADHHRSDCTFKNALCFKCHKRGHIAKVCRSKVDNTSYNVNTIVSSTFSSDSVDTAFSLSLSVDHQEVHFQLDTGSPVTIINSDTWKRLGKPKLHQNSMKYSSFTGHSIRFRGESWVEISYNGKFFSLKTLVVFESQANILGRDWIKALQLLNKSFTDRKDTTAVCSIQSSLTDLQEICTQYKEIFEDQLGCCKLQAQLHLKPDVLPKFFKPRSIPFAYRDAVEAELVRFVENGILEPVDFSKWAAPIVAVPKPGGKVRICADFSTGINQAIDIDQYPLPRPDELFAVLNGGKFFSKIDFSEAYLQVPMDETSKNILVINTHKGLYRYNRLPFGIASAPSIFQKLMDTMLSGLDGTVAYLDDIIVTGCSELDHLKNLKNVFARIQDFGFKINKQKCSFLQSEVEYLGFVVNSDGIHTSTSKTVAIREMPQPSNVSQLKSFLGMVNHYAKFIPHLASQLTPLYALLKQDVRWHWNADCSKVFVDIKNKLSSSLTLTHYDPKEKLVLATDASSYGLGAVIYHRFANGNEKPIAYASKTLTKTEAGYAQIEKEALGIMFGLQKFDEFLRGRRFTLVTDHQPLITIFGPKRGIPTTSANRLQRWAIRLMAYSYDIEYCSTTRFGHADGLSRLPIGPDSTFDTASAGEGQIVAAIQQEYQAELPIRAKQVAQATLKDKVLSLIYRYTQDGWPETHPIECQSYFKIRYELSTSYGCIVWGLRTVIPLCFRTRLLNHLHLTHSGMARMKAEARRYFWWPNLDSDIERVARNCRVCTENSKQTVKVPMNQWSPPDHPWQRIHIDFMGKFLGLYFLVIVDAYSKWVEVITMTTITSQITINALSSLFARFGVCSFRSLPNFCSRNGIDHVRTAPAHAQSNGQAERYVETVKSALTKIVHEGGSVTEALMKFLFNYRTTPHATTGQTPAELFLKRPLRTVLDLLRPNYAEATRLAHNRYQVNFDKKSKERYFTEGDKVLVRDFRASSTKTQWKPGSLIHRQGSRLWLVKVGDQTWRRHENQLQFRHWDDSEDNMDDIIPSTGVSQAVTLDANEESNLVSVSSTPTTTTTASTSSSSSSSDQESPMLRRTTRIRKPPQRLIEEI